MFITLCWSAHAVPSWLSPGTSQSQARKLISKGEWPFKSWPLSLSLPGAMTSAALAVKVASVGNCIDHFL